MRVRTERHIAVLYLICTDAAQVEHAAKIWGKNYTCISREQAMNGMAAELADKKIVIWPTPEHVTREHRWATELAAFSPEVKLIHTELGSDIPFSVMVTIPWTAEDAFNWLTGKQDEYERIELIEAIADTPINAGARLSGPPFGDTDAAGLPSSALDADAPAPLSEETGDWTALEAPPSDDHPGLAGRAYIPHETAAGFAAWPEPLDLTKSLYRGLPMPLSLVPVPLQPFVGDNAHRLGTGYGPVWFGVQGALAGMCSDALRLQVKQHDTWTVHPSVWGMVIGSASSGKTPALEVGMRWVQRKDAGKVIENMRKQDDYDHLYKQYEAACAIAVREKLPRPEKPEMPVLTEYWLNNGTREGAVRMLQHSRKFCYYLDEASAFITALDRYAAGGKGSGDREFWLSTWNSGPSKTSLANRTISIPNCSAALVGGTTPTSMRNAAGGKLQSDGLLARFLICNIPDKLSGDDTTPDAAAIGVYDRVLSNLIDMKHSATLKLSAGAAEIYREFCDDLTKRIRSEDNDELTASLGKWYGTWGRLALIYHLTECAAHGQAPIDGHTIPASIAAHVTAFMRWQIGHQQQFWFETMSNKVGRKFAQLIARYILANEELTVLNFRDHVSRPNHKALESLRPWEIKEAVNTLINAAWLTPIGMKTNTYGVPNSYDINPRIKSMFDDEREQEKERRAISREALQAMREPGSD